MAIPQPVEVRALVTMASAGRDWIALVFGLVGPLASAAVVIVAVVITTESARKLAERQTKVEEAKLKLELFDRRYDAWMELRLCAERRYRAILSLKPEDSIEDAILRDEQVTYNRGAERLYFLFGDEVHQATIVLNGLLAKYWAATKAQRNATNPQSAIILSGKTVEAMGECEEALNRLKFLIKAHIQPLA